MGRSTHKGKGELPVRRFSVHVRPMRPTAEGQIYSAWRLQEMEVDRKQDKLKSAFSNYPRAVIAVERSGAIAWMNDSAGDLFGVKVGQPLSLGDLVLGESAPVLRNLWEEDAGEAEARIRQRKGGSGSLDVILQPFTRGGAGEGLASGLRPLDLDLAQLLFTRKVCRSGTPLFHRGFVLQTTDDPSDRHAHAMVRREVAVDLGLDQKIADKAPHKSFVRLLWLRPKLVERPLMGQPLAIVEGLAKRDCRAPHLHSRQTCG